MTGSQLAVFRRDLNALTTMPLATHNCVAGDDESDTLTVRTADHVLVFLTTIEGCSDVPTTVDGRQVIDLRDTQQLDDDIYAAVGIVRTPIPPVPPQGPAVRTAPPRLTTIEHNAVQAMRVASADRDGVGTPPDFSYQWNAGVISRPPYPGPGTPVNWTSAYTVKGTVSQLIAWYRAYPAPGTIAAEPQPEKDGIRRLVMEPTDHTKTVPVLYWVSMKQRGDVVVFRIDTEAAWE